MNSLLSERDIYVSLNGVDLQQGDDYYWLTEGRRGMRLVLRRPRPYTQPLTFCEKIRLFLRFRWAELRIPRISYPDLVVIEHWSAGIRDTFLLGTPEFDEYVCYHEDVEG